VESKRAIKWLVVCVCVCARACVRACVYTCVRFVPSLLLRCWLGGRNGIWPVKSDELLAWLKKLVICQAVREGSHNVSSIWLQLLQLADIICGHAYMDAAIVTPEHVSQPRHQSYHSMHARPPIMIAMHPCVHILVISYSSTD